MSFRSHVAQAASERAEIETLATSDGIVECIALEYRKALPDSEENCDALAVRPGSKAHPNGAEPLRARWLEVLEDKSPPRACRR
jgi:hypothetical protein